MTLNCWIIDNHGAFNVRLDLYCFLCGYIVFLATWYNCYWLEHGYIEIKDIYSGEFFQG